MNRKVYTRIICLILGLAAVLLLFAYFTEIKEETRINLNIALHRIDNVTLDRNAMESNSVLVEGRRGEMHILEGRLPNEVFDGCYLTLKSQYCKVNVYIDNERVYSYPSEKHLSFSRLSGNVRLVVPVEKADAGKNFFITFEPSYNQAFNIEGVYYDYLGNIYCYVLGRDLYKFVIIIFMITVFCLTLGINILGVKKGSNINTVLLHYFIGFVLVVATWVFCSSELPQLFTRNNGSISLTSYLSLSLMCPLFCGFCYEVFSVGNKFIRALQILGWITVLLNIVLVGFGIADSPEILLLTHINMVLTIIMALTFSVMSYRNSVEARLLTLANFWLAFCGMLGLYSYYTAPSSGWDGTVLGTGLVIFTLVLFCLILYRQISFIEERKYLDTYKELAYKDILTGLGNRKAFDEEMSKLKKDRSSFSKISLAMLDVNYLKKTNDLLGHEKGDSLLLETAKCISSAFGKLGKSYRLGGDEFAVTLVDVDMTDREIADLFDDYMEKYNREKEREISVAIGVSSARNTDDENLATIYSRADKAMYERKSEIHATQNK